VSNVLTYVHVSRTLSISSEKYSYALFTDAVCSTRISLILVIGKLFQGTYLERGSVR
jgi:hypothetical protein